MSNWILGKFLGNGGLNCGQSFIYTIYSGLHYNISVCLAMNDKQYNCQLRRICPSCSLGITCHQKSHASFTFFLFDFHTQDSIVFWKISSILQTF